MAGGILLLTLHGGDKQLAKDSCRKKASDTSMGGGDWTWDCDGGDASSRPMEGLTERRGGHTSEPIVKRMECVW